MNRNTKNQLFYDFENDVEEKGKFYSFLNDRGHIKYLMEDLVQEINIPKLKEILHIIYEIVRIVELKEYEHGYEACLNNLPHRTELDRFLVDTSAGYHDSSYYKPICKKEDVGELLKNGLCCGVCSNYKSGLCQNRIYTEFRMPKVEPYQICECVKFNGKRYKNYYFSKNEYRGHQSGDKQPHKKHFSQVADRTIDELQRDIGKMEDFENFIREEIPEVYSKLMKEFKKRKEILQ